MVKHWFFHPEKESHALKQVCRLNVVENTRVGDFAHEGFDNTLLDTEDLINHFNKLYHFVEVNAISVDFWIIIIALIKSSATVFLSIFICIHFLYSHVVNEIGKHLHFRYSELFSELKWLELGLKREWLSGRVKFSAS